MFSFSVSYLHVVIHVCTKEKILHAAGPFLNFTHITKFLRKYFLLLAYKKRRFKKNKFRYISTLIYFFITGKWMQLDPVRNIMRTSWNASRSCPYCSQDKWCLIFKVHHLLSSSPPRSFNHRKIYSCPASSITILQLKSHFQSLWSGWHCPLVRWIIMFARIRMTITSEWNSASLRRPETCPRPVYYSERSGACVVNFH